MSRYRVRATWLPAKCVDRRAMGKSGDCHQATAPRHRSRCSSHENDDASGKLGDAEIRSLRSAARRGTRGTNLLEPVFKARSEPDYSVLRCRWAIAPGSY